jgi:deoxycytidylate deaminase
MPNGRNAKSVQKTDRNGVQETPESSDYPELIFGLVGPIGVDMDAVTKALKRSLEGVGYSSHMIHLTKLMEHKKITVKRDDSSYYARYISLIKYANAYRDLLKNPKIMAGIAISKIREMRESETGDPTIPSRKTAYIVRQFKRPEEIEVMRLTYGRKFFQLSLHASDQERREVLIQKIKDYDASPKKATECEKEAIDLIQRDYDEAEEEFGQRVGGVFHLGDAFVPGIGENKIEPTVQRLVSALFGHNGVSPTRDEYGMYIANSTSLRSIDLSRQVGAAIFTDAGELVSMGCNKVPKAFGGTYWGEGPQTPCRDFEFKQLG